jgi:NAD(P)-dependent dehydrogenase (short-subunit alcohol dehydrogenase family)
MSADSSNRKILTILLIAASRGLGLAMAAEFLKKGWNVVGTIREGSGRTNLHDLGDEFKGRLEVETLDYLGRTVPW